MPFPEDLIQQARDLVESDRGRPRQASLRRAVSASYYALFHCLADGIVSDMLENRFHDGPIGLAVRRHLEHKHAYASSKAFLSLASSGPTGLQRVRAQQHGTPTPSPPEELLRFCRTFVDLQEERHRADYNLADGFLKQEAVGLIEESEQAVIAYRALPRGPDRLLHTLSCLHGPEIFKRC